MSLRRHDVFAAAALCGGLSAGAAWGFAPTPTDNLEIQLAIEARAPFYTAVRIADAYPAHAATVGLDWHVQVNDLTGKPHLAWGGSPLRTDRSIAQEGQAIDAARSVLESLGDLLGATAQNSQVLKTASVPGKWAVHFQQMLNGIPVHTGKAFVFLSESGNVIAFGSDFFPVAPGTLARAQISAAQAIDAAARSIGTTPRADRATSSDLVYVPDLIGGDWQLKIAYQVVFEAEQPFGKWLCTVDGTNGDILARRNLFHAVNVTGTVQGDIEDFGYCDGVATDVLENLRVNVTGGNNDVSDDDGFFDITHGGAAPVTVTAQFLGPFINVNRYSGLGADATFSGSATPGTPLIINWTNANSRADERDTFFHGNRVHDFMKAIDPGFNGLDYAMPTSVGRTDGFCPGNAWWDGNGINFCEASGSWANTGRIGNVIYHEYGHGVTSAVYPGDPSSTLHEGNADVLANLIDRQPIIGLGFTLNNCGNGIRNSDNNLEYPDDVNGEGHHDGQIIAGFIWDSWQGLLAALPQAEADDVIQQVWHQSREIGLPSTMPDQVSWSFLVDDDDANLNNGTPHHEFLCVGASNHGFNCPTITEGLFITHTPLHHTDDGAAGLDVDAVITSTEAALDAANLLVHYRVNGGTFSQLLMTPTGNPDEYSAHIPALNGNSELEYYISALDQADNSRLSPGNAPASLYALDVAHVYDGLEAGTAGWQIGVAGDNATSGIWTAVNPIGWFSTAYDSYSQPEDDSTPGAGVTCFITGQCCNPCTNGCADVDGGTTTLLSAVYDLSGANSAKIKYDRWYSSHTGGAPNTDLWTVDISNDGGATWVNVESTTQTIPEPFSSAWALNTIDIDALFGAPNQVRLRFRARDLSFGSTVEAGVDEIRVLADFGATGVDELASPAALSFSLSQNQPNPFSPMTRIDFAVPARSDVSLAVYDVAGRLVRTLASGLREAGRYAMQWDGKDSGGKRVSAGVYFYRLTSEGESLTRKMTVLK